MARRRYLVEIGPGKTWPENPGLSGASGTSAVDPYSWIRWDSRGLADVVMSIDGAIEQPGGVANPRQYYDYIPAGETNVRNIGKPAATELHFLNVDATNNALLWIELDTEPIVDLGNTRILLDRSKKPIGSASGQPLSTRLQDGTGSALAGIFVPSDGDGSIAQLVTTARPQYWNGSAWDRSRSASAANLIAQSGLGAALVAPPGMWSATSVPAVGVVASATRAAGAAGVRHMAWGQRISAFATTAAPGATTVEQVLRDGASGVGTAIEQIELGLQAAAGAGMALDSEIENLPGSAATAMTSEFGGGVTNAAQRIALKGYDAS